MTVDRYPQPRSASREERAEIAAELWDVVAHSVSAMVVQSSAAGRRIPSDRRAARGLLAEVQTVGRNCRAELRYLTDVLGSARVGPTLDQLELLLELTAAAHRAAEGNPDRTARAVVEVGEAGRRLLARLRDVGANAPAAACEALCPQPSIAELGELVRRARAAGADVHVSVDAGPTRMPAGVDLAAYRFIEASIAAAVGKAGASRVEVDVRFGADALWLESRHDGRPPPREGYDDGLAAARERVGIYGGTVTTEATATGGRRLHAFVPLVADVAP